MPPHGDLMPLMKASEDEDVANRTIGVFIHPFPPYTVMKPPAELTGYNGDMWNILEKVLRFRTVLTVVEDFAEAQRRLERGEADVFLHPIIITPTDVDRLAFSRHITSTWYELYVRRPDSQATWQAYVRACSSAAWAAILACVLLLTLGRSLLLRRRSSVGVALLSVLGAIFNQGVQDESRGRRCSQRVLTTFTLVFGLLLVNAYSAALTARLTVVVTPLPFTSLEEVATARSHALCVRRHNFADSLFTVRELGDVREPWRGVLRRGPCADFRKPSQVREKACAEGVALLETPALMADAMRDAPCHVTRVDSRRYAGASAALQLRPRFPLAARINSRLLRMHEAGVTHFLRNKWVTKPLRGEEDAAPGGSVVPSKHYEAILALYMAAVALSAAVLLLELVWHHFLNLPQHVVRLS